MAQPYSVYKKIFSNIIIYVVECKRMLQDKSYKNNNKNQEWAIIILDRRDFRAKIVIDNKERHYIILKRSIHQEYLSILNVYASKKEKQSWKVHKLKSNRTEKRMGKSKIVVKNYNNSLSATDKTTKQKKISKGIEKLTNTLNLQILFNIYTTSLPQKQSTFSFQVPMRHSPR